jgi:hypothetical protein
MKNLLYFGLLLSSFLSFGQIREKGHIELSPIIGYSSSNQLQSFLFGSSPVSGIQIGAYGNYFLNDRWSLRSGLLLQKMGAEKVEFGVFSNEYSEKTSYITLPITINYHFGGKRNWYINYGVSAGALTNAEADYHDGGGFVTIKDIANPIQFGINSGIGYKFEITPGFSLIIDNSNMVGLTRTTEEKKGTNFYMSLNLGVVYKI